jgi:trigger factor
MQVSLENVGQFERKLTVRIPTEHLENRVQARLSELSRTIRLKGFRPGKVPSKVIEQKFGAQTRKEAYSELISSTYQEALRQQKLRPAVPPSITAEPVSNVEIGYTAVFEVMPELERIDVAQLQISKIVSQVEESDIDRMIETLRMQRKQWKTVDRAAQDGDAVVLEYAITADGVSYPKQGLEKAVVVLGAGTWFPELEKKLLGVSAKEEINTSIVMPERFREPGLAGKSVSVHVRVIRIQEGHLPLLDESFVESFGIREGGMEQFRADVRANLEREVGATVRGRVRADAISKLIAQYADLQVPSGMVSSEAKALLGQARQQAERAGAQPPADETLFEKEAVSRVRAFVLLTEIARQNAIVPDQGRMRDMLMTIASTYEEPEKVIDLYKRDPEMMASLRNRVMEDQVVDWVVEHAQTQEQRLSFSEIMQQTNQSS